MPLQLKIRLTSRPGKSCWAEHAGAVLAVVHLSRLSMSLICGSDRLSPGR